MERRSLTVLFGRASIGEVSRRTNLTPRAIRLYEQKGLIEVRRDDTGARDYPPETVERLTFISLARRAGFTLRDIAELIKLSRSRSANAAADRALELCERRLEDLDREREGVRQMAAAMRSSAEAPWRAERPARATLGARQ